MPILRKPIRRTRQIITLMAIIVVAVTFLYVSSIKTTEGVFRVIGVTDQGIVVQQGQQTANLKTTPDIMQLVQIDQLYFIRYHSDWIRNPKLEDIQLVAPKSAG